MTSQNRPYTTLSIAVPGPVTDVRLHEVARDSHSIYARITPSGNGRSIGPR